MEKTLCCGGGGTDKLDVEQEVLRRYKAGARAMEPSLCCPVQYQGEYLKILPKEIIEKDYGCGDPSVYVNEGERVLDLGSGSGKICYILSQKVGSEGHVIGVDFNLEMLALSRKYLDYMKEKLGYGNVEFLTGKIQDLALDLDMLQTWIDNNPVTSVEDLGTLNAECERFRRDHPLVPDDTIDVVVSNCVLNLVRTEEKDNLFKEIYRVLKRGGRAVISDIVCDEAPTEKILNDPELWSGCISGAFQEDEFLKKFENTGFSGVELLKRESEPWRIIDGIEFRSVTVRAFKGKEVPCLERNPKETKGLDYDVPCESRDESCCSCSYEETSNDEQRVGFEEQIEETTGEPLTSKGLDILQINLGYLCNMSCAHCHLGASPDRTEIMEWSTMETILDILKDVPCRLVDLTGGAPEMSPNFRRFVEALSEMDIPVQVRTNLTVLLESGMEDMPEFFKNHGVQIVASMPCYLEKNVRAQRGAGVYEKSIEAIKRLNSLGYGVDPDYQLNLVYNPCGPFLPPDQNLLEQDYHRELMENYGISFTNLLTITNAPIGRFLKSLHTKGQEVAYMDLLRQSFNPETAEGLMCRHQISIGWDGTLYDCDFNLALGLPVNHGAPCHITDFDLEALVCRQIVTGDHCFACTAGSGSSCAGELSKRVNDQ